MHQCIKTKDLGESRLSDRIELMMSVRNYLRRRQRQPQVWLVRAGTIASNSIIRAVNTLGFTLQPPQPGRVKRFHA